MVDLNPKSFVSADSGGTGGNHSSGTGNNRSWKIMQNAKSQKDLILRQQKQKNKDNEKVFLLGIFHESQTFMNKYIVACSKLDARDFQIYKKALVDYTIALELLTNIHIDYKQTFKSHSRYIEAFENLEKSLLGDPKILTVKQFINEYTCESNILSTSTASLTSLSPIRSQNSNTLTVISDNGSENGDKVDNLLSRFTSLKPKKERQSSTSSNTSINSFNANYLMLPNIIHYGAKSPSQDKNELEIDELEDNSIINKIFNNNNGNHTRYRTYINIHELYEVVKETPKSLLLIDVRTRKEFDKSHIKFDNIICIEPFTLESIMTEGELRDSLTISPEFERELFQKRDLFPLIVAYDNTFTIDAIDKFHNFPPHFTKLLSLLNEKSPVKLLKRNPLFLNGGFLKWTAIYGKPFVTEPRDEKISFPPLSLSRSSDFRKNSADNIHNDLLFKNNIDFPSLYSPVSYLNFSQQQPAAVLLSKNNNNNNSSPISVSSFSSGALNNIKNNNPVFTNSNFTNSFNSINLQNNSSSPSPLISSNTTTATAVIDQQPTVPEKLFLDTSNLQIKVPKDTFSPIHSSSNGSGLLRSALNVESQYSTTSPIPQLPDKITNGSSSSFSNFGSSSNNLNESSSSLFLGSSVEITTGLSNLGNTCYLNSVVQCLSATYELLTNFLTGKFEKHINFNSKLGSKGVLAKSFYELLKQMSAATNNINKYIVPKNFKIVCGSINSEFNNNDQQDCQEFLNFILDGLHEDLNQAGGAPPLPALTEEQENRREQMPLRLASAIEWEKYLKTNFSTITDIFQGQYSSRLSCLTCGKTSTTYQAFSTLSLPIPLRNDGHSITIYDCFEEFLKEEVLDGDDRWNCPKCKQFRKSTKQLKITRLPKVLIIHLKKFKPGFQWREKLDTLVTYPISDTPQMYYNNIIDDEGIVNLDQYWVPILSNEEKDKLRQFESRGQVPPFKYKVYGVINHHGKTVYSGHYTCFVYKGNIKRWCFFDDTKVYVNRRVSEIVSKDNYVLFLNRV